MSARQINVPTSGAARQNVANEMAFVDSALTYRVDG
jgi:hypothetical protein